MTVKAILSRKGTNVVTIAPTASISDAVRILNERRIGAIIVQDGAGAAGLISERDVVRVLAERGSEALTVPVGDVMTRKLVTCTPADTVDRIMEQMTSGKFRHVPVLDNGRLAGIISIGDVVKHRLEEMEQESTAMRDYIRSA
jgi:CBS domain-containing protein